MSGVKRVYVEKKPEFAVQAKDLLKHIEVKTALGDELIGRMQRVSEN